MVKEFNQVKLSSVGLKNVDNLFRIFRFKTLLNRSKITKQKGYQVSELILYLLFVMLENSNSVFAGIVKNQIPHLKTPINDMLNNADYNWRDLLFRVAKLYSKIVPAKRIEDCSLIFDDTSKVKTGRKTQGISWFFDHSKGVYFKGYQNTTCVWSNGMGSIPVDFELKMGKKKAKHSRKPSYHKGTHTEQRVRFAKEKKTDIVIRMLKRVLQRKLPFQYILWDSWYNCSKSYSYVFDHLIPSGKVLVSMLKKGTQKYKYREHYLSLKELYRKAGKWNCDKASGIQCKSIEVELLDASETNIIANRKAIGKIKICFFKYPGVKKWKAIVSTDRELSEIEVLKIYLRRWSIECIFKEIRQYFGYDQSKSSNYAAMIADLTIRYVFYTMFCYRKIENHNKPMGQIVFEFYQELFDLWLTAFVELMMMRTTKQFLDYVIELGYTEMKEVRKNIDALLTKFFEQDDWIEKITDSDKHEFRKTA